MTNWHNGNIVKIEDASPTTKRFWLEVEGAEKFDFKAGQFITMDLPIGERRNQRWRSYSIASAPNGSNVMELCIVHLDGGLASGYLFNDAKIGTSIKFKGPDGGFVLPEKLENELVLVCTGTGVAPFRSMIWEVFEKKIPNKGIHLIFGTRTSDGILYQQEFEELVQKMPGFRYSVALSREEKADCHHGYIHQIYQKDYPEKRLDVTFYLCGWTNMVDEAVANLIVKMGYGREQVKYELYG